MAITWRTALVLLVAASAAGCRDEAPAPSSAPEATAPAAPAPRDGSGLERAAREALTCAWRAGFSVGCAPYAAWLDLLEDAEADAGLVEMLASDDERVRYLAASGLLRRGTAVLEDPGLARAVVDAAREEHDPAVATPLGGVAARLDLEGAERVGAVRDLLADHPLAELRAALAGDLLLYGGEAWSGAVREAARADPAPAVRAAAVTGFWAWGGGDDEAVCGLWLALADDEAARVAEAAARALTTGGRCGDRLDDLLDVLDQRAREGRLTRPLVETLDALAGGASTPASRRDRVLEVARAAAEHRDNGWAVRDRALDLLVERDPAVRDLLERLAAEEPALAREKLEALEAPEEDAPEGL